MILSAGLRSQPPPEQRPAACGLEALRGLAVMRRPVAARLLRNLVLHLLLVMGLQPHCLPWEPQTHQADPTSELCLCGFLLLEAGSPDMHTWLAPSGHEGPEHRPSQRGSHPAERALQALNDVAPHFLTALVTVQNYLVSLPFGVSP